MGRRVVVVAGMEGALPSVIAGLVDRPVVAVPTSVGYGASFGGVAAPRDAVHERAVVEQKGEHTPCGRGRA